MLNHSAIAAITGTSPCSGAPTLTGCTAVDDGLQACPGGGWRTHATCTISGTLQPTQEFVWERQIDRSGTWNEQGRTTTTTGPTVGQNTIGSNGTGASETHYAQWRVYVVPVGASTANACSGPSTSSELSKTANSCLS